MTVTPLPDWVKPGAAYRFDAGPANPHTGRKFHVRALVDDQVVIREWRNGMWRYRIESAEYFTVMADYISEAKP